MHKEIWQKKIRLRKNFFSTLLLVIFLWAGLFSFTYFIGPDSFVIILLFFLLFWLASFFTFSALFINTRRGLLTACGLSLFLILRYFGLGNILNFILIMGVIVSIDIYLSR